MFYFCRCPPAVNSNGYRAYESSCEKGNDPLRRICGEYRYTVTSAYTKIIAQTVGKGVDHFWEFVVGNSLISEYETFTPTPLFCIGIEHLLEVTMTVKEYETLFS